MRTWKFAATRTAFRRAHVSDNDKAALDMMIRGHGIQTVAVPGFVDWGASLGWSCVRCGDRVLLAFVIPYYNEWQSRALVHCTEESPGVRFGTWGTGLRPVLWSRLIPKCYSCSSATTADHCWNFFWNTYAHRFLSYFPHKNKQTRLQTQVVGRFCLTHRVVAKCYVKLHITVTILSLAHNITR